MIFYGDGCARTVFKVASTASPSWLMTVGSQAAFYGQFLDIGISASVAGPVLQIGLETYADAFNGFIFRAQTWNLNATSSACGIEINGAYNCDFLATTNNAGYGDSLRCREMAFCRVFGSFSTAQIGLHLTAYYVYGNIFESLDLEVVNLCVQIDSGSAVNNTWIGGQFVWTNNTVGTSVAAINATAGSNNRFIGVNFASNTTYTTGATGIIIPGLGIGTETFGSVLSLSAIYVAPATANDADLILNSPAGNSAWFYVQHAGSTRWAFGHNNTTESGSNVGSDFQLTRSSDAGVAIDNPLVVTRSTGLVQINTLAVSSTSSLAAATATTPAPGTNSTAVATTAYATAANAIVAAGAAANQGRNQVLNGRFLIQQRGQGPWTASGSFTADRWEMNLSGDTDSVSIVALADADRAAIGDEYAESALQVVLAGSSAATSYSQIFQRMEDVRRLGNKTVTVSFYAKASVALSAGGYFVQVFGTGGSPSGAVASSTTTFAITTAWARYSATFTLPSTAGKTLGTNGDYATQLAFNLSSGSNNAASFGVGVQSGTFSFFGVQCETGTVTTALESRNIGTELSQCQRYYQLGQVYWGGYGVAGASALASAAYATPMRAVPAVAISANSSSNLGSSVLAADAALVSASGTVTASGATVLNMTLTASADL